MKITKYGHCCLLIETDGKRILTDPGIFTSDQRMPEHIDLVVISHEHHDHFHVPSVKEVLQTSPQAIVVCNSAVGALLKQEGVPYEILEGETSAEYKDIFVQAHDASHAEIYKELGQVQNTGYFITKNLFYPGDSFEDPVHQVQVLALPIAGPWCKVKDAIQYGIAVKPKAAFPVHDGIEREDRVGVFHGMLKKVLTDEGIDFRPMKGGDTETFVIE